MKSLRIIQILAKVARIICLVLYILCIVGASGCAIALIVLPIFQNLPMADGKTLADLLLEKGTQMFEIYLWVAIGLLSCGVGIFIFRYNQVFFEKEIALGTPFDMEIVKKMRKLALVCVITSVAYSIVCAIIVSSVYAANHVTASYRYETFSSISYGLFMLVLSLFCEYGAEINAKPKELSEENKEEENKEE